MTLLQEQAPSSESFERAASDTPLFRDSPLTISEVFASWDDFKPPEEKSHEEERLEEFLSELGEYLKMYDKALAAGRPEIIEMYRDGIWLMIASIKASGCLRTKPELYLTIDCIAQSMSDEEKIRVAA